MKHKKRLTLIALGAVALYLLVLSPLDGAREELRQDYYVSTHNKAKLEGFVSKYGPKAESLQEHRAAIGEMELSVIHEKDPSLAFAFVQGKIQDMAAEAFIEISTIKSLSTSQEQGYIKIPVLVTGKGTIDSVNILLKQLDNDQDLLAVEKLKISTGRPEKQLSIILQVTGLMKSE